MEGNGSSVNISLDNSITSETVPIQPLPRGELRKVKSHGSQVVELDLESCSPNFSASLFLSYRTASEDTNWITHYKL